MPHTPTPTPPHSHLPTHEVQNQPVPRGARDLWAQDPILQSYAAHAGADLGHLRGAGRAYGTIEALFDAAEARRDLPRLVAFNRDGTRADEVHFNAAYHRLMALGISQGYAALPWRDGGQGGHATHAALVYFQAQLEPGVSCPLTMTYAAIPALNADAALAALWRPKLMSHQYDPAIAPVAGKQGATLGMAMTEKQGGSDVRANTTRAERDGDIYRLFGHKWFCSAPMSDGFLTLAHTPEGLTCFLVPRWLEGQRNAIHLMRLKDKLGNHANASSEIEYHGAVAQRLGDEGQGVKTIIEMVHHTRLDTALAPAGLMRAALAEALWWAEGRRSFQRRLIDQPLMRAVLADLALDLEAATALGFGCARAFDGTTAEDRAFARIAVALAKYLSNKRAPGVIYEAMECLGGMGYIEETPMPMLYREAPLNSIWEGSGNIICLDILRSLSRAPLAGHVLHQRLQRACGYDAGFARAYRAHQARWPALPAQAEARWFVESLAQLLAGAMLIEVAPQAVTDAFIATRLLGQRGATAGAMAQGDLAPILARLCPPD